MTQSIERGTRDRVMARPTSDSAARRRRPLFMGVGCFTAVVATGGAICSIATLFGASWRVALMGVTLLVLAGLGGVVLCLQWMLVDRQDFYRRGHLDGWMRGWRGQEPGGDDPILR